MTIYILFFVKNLPPGKFCEPIAKDFRCFHHRGNFFDGAKILQILSGTGAIELVQKLSKAEPSSRFCSGLKFREKFLLAGKEEQYIINLTIIIKV